MIKSDIERMWINHPEFSIIRQQSSSQRWRNVIKRGVLGNIFNRNRMHRARLLGYFDKALNDLPYDSLLKLESKLKKELSQVLKDEELFWNMKARIDWIQEGDRNITFYHASTLVRPNRNKILLDWFWRWDLWTSEKWLCLAILNRKPQWAKESLSTVYGPEDCVMKKLYNYAHTCAYLRNYRLIVVL